MPLTTVDFFDVRTEVNSIIDEMVFRNFFPIEMWPSKYFDNYINERKKLYKIEDEKYRFKMFLLNSGFVVWFISTIVLL